MSVTGWGALVVQELHYVVAVKSMLFALALVGGITLGLRDANACICTDFRYSGVRLVWPVDGSTVPFDSQAVFVRNYPDHDVTLEIFDPTPPRDIDPRIPDFPRKPTMLDLEQWPGRYKLLQPLLPNTRYQLRVFRPGAGVASATSIFTTSGERASAPSPPTLNDAKAHYANLDRVSSCEQRHDDRGAAHMTASVQVASDVAWIEYAHSVDGQIGRASTTVIDRGATGVSVSTGVCDIGQISIPGQRSCIVARAFSFSGVASEFSQVCAPVQDCGEKNYNDPWDRSCQQSGGCNASSRESRDALLVFLLLGVLLSPARTRTSTRRMRR